MHGSSLLCEVRLLLYTQESVNDVCVCVCVCVVCVCSSIRVYTIKLRYSISQAWLKGEAETNVGISKQKA